MKHYFVGYQITNLIFQIILIPLLYKNISLESIGTVLIYNFISQIIIIGILGGSSVLGVTEKGKLDLNMNVSVVLKIQMQFGLISGILFLMFSSIISHHVVLNSLFSVYIASSALSVYWLVIKYEKYSFLFLVNIISKILFFVIMGIWIKYHYCNEEVAYALSIVTEFLIMNTLFLSDTHIRSDFKNTMVVALTDIMYKSYVSVSFAELTKSAVKESDKILISLVLTPQAIAIYNLIFKMVDIPSNLTMQFNYLMMRHKTYLLYTALKTSVISFLVVVFIYFSYYFFLKIIINANMADEVFILNSYLPLFLLLIIFRPLMQTINYMYYHDGYFSKLITVFSVYSIIFFILGFIIVGSIESLLIYMPIMEFLLILLLILLYKKVKNV